MRRVCLMPSGLGLGTAMVGKPSRVGKQEAVAEVVFFLSAKRRCVHGECFKPCAWVEGAWGEKPGITLPTSAIGLGITVPTSAIGLDVGVFLALDFNEYDLLCAFLWVYNGWRLSVRDIFLGRPSIILIGPL